MEFVAIGSALWMAKNLMPEGSKTIDGSDVEKMQTPEEFLRKEYKRAGMIAPVNGHVHQRLPWDPANPPYDIWKPSDDEEHKNPSDRMYDYAVAAQEHYRKDYEQQLDAGYEYYIQRRGGAIVNTFTRELHNPNDPSMRTGFINHSWLPPNPQDADYVRAGELARRLPRDPSLFSPDSTFMNAPGLPFRYRH